MFYAYFQQLPLVFHAAADVLSTRVHMNISTINSIDGGMDLFFFQLFPQRCSRTD